MARLNTVSLGGGVGQRIGAGKLEALAYQGIKSTESDIAKVTDELSDITEATRARQVSDAAVQKSKSDNDFLAQNEGKEFYTAEEVDSLGVTDVNLTEQGEEGEEIMRENIPAHEVFPQALEAHMKKSRTAAGTKIGFPGTRETWDAKNQIAEQEMIARARTKSMKDQQAYHENQTNQDIAEFIDQGDPDMAVALAQTHPDVANRKAHVAAAKVAWDEEVGTKVDTAIKQGDYARATELSGSIFDKEARESSQAGIGKRIEKHAYSQSILDGDRAEVRSDIAHLRSNDYDGTLTETERKELVVSMSSWERTQAANAVNGKNYELGLTMSKMELAAEAGEMDMATVDELIAGHGAANPKTLTPEWRTKIGKVIVKQEIERKEREKTLFQITGAVTGTNPMVVSTPKEKEVVDKLHEDMIKKAGGNTAEVMRITSQVAAGTGYIPTAVRNEMQGARNGKLPPERVEAVAAQYNDLVNIAPATLEDLPDSVRSYMSEIAGLQSSGMDIASSIETIQKRYTLTEILRDERKTEYGTITKADPNADSLQDFMDSDPHYDGGFFFFDDAVPLEDQVGPSAGQMQRDFETQVQALYLINGDLEASQKVAYEGLKGMYSVSNINGQEAPMKFSPERSSGLDTKTLKTQLDSKLKALGLEDLEGIIVDSDQITATKGSRSWGIYQLNEHNMPMPVKNADGSDYRWTIDTAAVKAKSDADQKAALDEEIAKYDQMEENKAYRAKRSERVKSTGMASYKQAMRKKSEQDAGVLF